MNTYKSEAYLKLESYIQENSEIWDLTDTAEFLYHHKDEIISLLKKL